MKMKHLFYIADIQYNILLHDIWKVLNMHTFQWVTTLKQPERIFTFEYKLYIRIPYTKHFDCKAT